MSKQMSLALLHTPVGTRGAWGRTESRVENLYRLEPVIDEVRRAVRNIVISRLGERNFGSQVPPRADRYARADDFLEVVTRLWEIWEPDAAVNDRVAGVWAKDEKIALEIGEVGLRASDEGIDVLLGSLSYASCGLWCDMPVPVRLGRPSDALVPA